jgi:chromosome segregation protein
VRLKSIKLAGFKSFVDVTSIPFPGDMTAVVGPNGCGKSNVIDAVRWVLGESSAKNLRGDAMTDVIFNGSSARKPVGQCSVELIFDNSSGRIAGEYAGFNELSIRRLVTRDAQSSYFLNGSKCRRRDVTDLFLGTGLGPRSYAIIEQGMISRLIESKPQELRVFIEEAAGISKYKERRRETENRIRHTHDNLARLEDVRGELAKQLEKLQRQAAAAKRYTALRSQERTLKAELAAIRWLKQNAILEKTEQQQQQLEIEVEGLIARQRGDEAGEARYRSQVQEYKRQLDALQQEVFTVSSGITRIEQARLHSQQREQQIQRELSQISITHSRLKDDLLEHQDKAAQCAQELMCHEPELAVHAEKLMQAENDRDDADTALQQFRREHQQQDLEYQQLKQQVQGYHSQLQATLTMQMRTQQRLGEVQQELKELADDSLTSTLDELLSRVAMAEAQADELALQCEQLAVVCEQTSQEYEQAQRNLRRCENEHQLKLSSLTALQTLQVEVESSASLPHSQALWRYLQPEPGFEALFEMVLRALGDPYFCDHGDVAGLRDELSAHYHGQTYLLHQYFSDKKIPNTLAEKLSNKTIPNCFNDIFVADDWDCAIKMHANLAPHQSVMTLDGEWLSADGITIGNAEKGDGVLQRSAKMTELEQQIAILDEQIDKNTDLVARCKQAKEAASHELQTAKQGLQTITNEGVQWQGKIDLLQSQQQQAQQRKSRLEEEHARQCAQLESEQGQMEDINEHLLELEEQVSVFEEQQTSSVQQQEKYQQAFDLHRQSVEQITRDLHQLELKVQQIQNQKQLADTEVQRLNAQLQDVRQRQQGLENELSQLLLPLETQQAQLQELLTKKTDLEDKQLGYRQQLAEIEAKLVEYQQSHQGLLLHIQQKQKAIEGLKLEAEGHRVRSASILEQLAETNHSLKSLLDTLDPNAEESVWQQELDQTTAAIGRLGAVNLAAVEEFDIQGERKAYLDAQHEDLVEALDTLQSAIRKIDKETKSRFRQTFDQVNNDLKQLFPKVFGGGSAYLALTDDDLLETGVTIMARPPGKKNSTIHLLSGGEKALTALSLVFAIFRLNPAPFCLLDEVDAPLDDANVGRFCNLVSEMSKSVQFIYITHNKIAMEMASHLTGVTMAEPGVSRMVAVDVDEAIAFAQA